MATRKELDELLAELNEAMKRRQKGELEFYITRPGDWRGTRYQLMWKGTGSNVSPTLNNSEMELFLRTAYRFLVI